MTIGEYIGRRALALREARGLSRRDMEHRCGLLRPNVARFERGDHEPLVDTARRIAEGLGVPVAALFEGWEDAHADHG